MEGAGPHRLTLRYWGGSLTVLLNERKLLDQAIELPALSHFGLRTQGWTVLWDDLEERTW